MEKLFHIENEHYPFEKPGASRREYTFLTGYEVIYRILFKPSPYVFGEDKPYAHLIYEFSILAEFAGPQSYVRDDLIAPTVVAIFLDFYNRNDQNVCFYICDSSDGKHHVRARKFDMWFRQYNRGAFSKLDSDLLDTNGDTIPVSIILTKSNIYLEAINQAFLQLITGYNDEK